MNYAQGNENDRIRGARGEGEALRHRVDRARDILESVRDRAESTIRERPLLVPVAAGALGVGIGVLLGSKLTRFLVFTAIGTVLSDTLGGEIKRLSREFLDDMQHRLSEGEAETAE